MVREKSLDIYLEEIQDHISHGRLNKALLNVKEAIKDFPTHTKLHINCGNLQHYLGLLDDAEKSFKTARELFESKEVLNNLGVVYIDKHMYDDAIDTLERSLGLDNFYPDALYNLSVCYDRKGDYEKTIAYLEECLNVDDGHLKANMLLFRTCQNTCNWKRLNELKTKIENLNTDGLEHPFLNVSRCDDEKSNYVNAVQWHKINYQHNISIKQKEVSSNRKKRISFICGELRDHPTFYLIKNMFQYLNKEAFDYYLFTYNHDQDYLNIIEKHVSMVVDINNRSDDQIESMLRGHDLDILIDLSVHIPHNKMNVVNRKLARKTISYLGFPGSSGSDNYDYIIADRIVIPEDKQNFYTEDVLYLPNIYQINDGMKKYPNNKSSKDDYSLPEEKIILSCFNQSFKIEEDIFKCWIQILKRNENTVLWLLEDNALMKQHVVEYLLEVGLNESRIIFAQRVPREAHIDRLGLSDIVLDTRTYNGHTTTTDAIQSGVPVVTVSGQHFASRVSHSILNSVGLNELVTNNLKDYTEKIHMLINDAEHRLSLCKKLKNEQAMKSFYDVKQFTKDFEEAISSVMN
tara:strand:- start:1072 stop:2796 length:1725 start_codon:yes stop_codon:yes gene_type:complete